MLMARNSRGDWESEIKILKGLRRILNKVIKRALSCWEGLSGLNISDCYSTPPFIPLNLSRTFTDHSSILYSRWSPLVSLFSNSCAILGGVYPASRNRKPVPILRIWMGNVYP